MDSWDTLLNDVAVEITPRLGSNWERRIRALRKRDEKGWRETARALERGIGAIEACAMESRGIPVNWEAVDATQDEMRRVLRAGCPFRCTRMASNFSSNPFSISLSCIPPVSIAIMNFALCSTNFMVSTLYGI